MDRRVITRADAGLPPTPAARVALDRKTITALHHSVTPQWTGVQAARNLYAIARSRGFIDTSYSWMADAAGNEVEGRGWGRVGGHTRGYNTVAEAICLVGNYDVIPPPPAMIAAAARLAARSQPGRVTHGHRDLGATACPGRYGYQAISAINAHAGEPDDIEENDVRWHLVIDPTGRILATSQWRLVKERGAARIVAHGRRAWHIPNPDVLTQLRDAGELASPDTPRVADYTAAAIAAGNAVHIGPATLIDLRDAGLLASTDVPEVDRPVVDAILLGGTA